MPVAPRGEIVDHGEIQRGAIGKVDLDIVVAVFEHVMEDRAAPVPRGVALTGRSVLECIVLVGFGVVPAKSAPLENRVQRIDEDQPARQFETACPAAFAKTADQVDLGQTAQALAHQPVHQVQSGRKVHATIMPRNRARRKALRLRARHGLAVFLHK